VRFTEFAVANPSFSEICRCVNTPSQIFIVILAIQVCSSFFVAATFMAPKRAGCAGNGVSRKAPETGIFSGANALRDP
jgi:hypothetical protein